MAKSLVIAEKPSVAADIARIMKVPEVRRGQYENNDYVVTSCFGHLTEIPMPDKDIPMPWLPGPLKTKPNKDSKERFDLIGTLLARPDIDCVINACDSGREGEAIFGRVTEGRHNKKVKRLWLVSQTDDGFRKAFATLKDGDEFKLIYEASKCRAEFDIVWGVNASRAVKRAVGRVRTPTFGLVAAAYIANRDFVPAPYWEVHSTTQIKAGQYAAKLTDESGNIAKFDKEEDALALIRMLSGKPTISIKDEEKISRQNAPLLFNGGDLQKEANRKYKFGMDKTLGLQQSLYEKFKMLTYPRSDSRVLGEDAGKDVLDLMKNLSGFGDCSAPAKRVVAENMVDDKNRNIFNNAKIIDSHGAVIPTGMIRLGNKEYRLDQVSVDEVKKHLSADEWKIFDLVAKRTVQAFFPPAVYAVTNRTHEIGGKIFKTAGKVLKEEGWLAAFPTEKKAAKKKDEEPALVALAAGEDSGQTLSVDGKRLMTKAPSLLDEAALMRQMETAGRDIADDDLAGLLKGKGIGTTATRPGIIKKIQSGENPDVLLQGNYLVPSPKSLEFYEYLQKHHPKALDPIYTAEMEALLIDVEEGKISRDKFRDVTNQEIADFYYKMAGQPFSSVQASGPEVCACPACKNGKLSEQKFSYACSCGFKVSKEIAGKKISVSQLKKLASGGKTDLIKGFTSKTGKKFDAVLKMEQDASAPGGWKAVFDFGNGAGAKSGGQERETSIDCPCCGNKKLWDKGRLITCPGCGFTVWRTAFGKELSNAELRPLLQNGRSELISGFVSKSSQKTYSAYLVVNKAAKKVELEFPPR